MAHSPPLTVADLRGKVVLVDFWTYTCINWLRQLPYVRAWAGKYSGQGLVVIGVHTPEFAFERNVENVSRAVREMRRSRGLNRARHVTIRPSRWAPETHRSVARPGVMVRPTLATG
jgi:thiol-disulfide isomerase/thioredoxin